MLRCTARLASSPISFPVPTATRFPTTLTLTLTLTVTLTLTLTILCVATLFPQERFQREGAKCLIWNQHKLES